MDCVEAGVGDAMVGGKVCFKRFAGGCTMAGDEIDVVTGVVFAFMLLWMAVLFSVGIGDLIGNPGIPFIFARAS